MKNSFQFVVAIAVLLQVSNNAIAWTCATSDKSDGADASTDSKIRQRVKHLIRELDDDAFQVRENSETELKRLGTEVVAPLKQALQSKSPEVRLRARRILKHIQPKILGDRFATFRGAVISRKNVSKIRLVAEIDNEPIKIVWSPSGKRVAFVHWEQPVEIRDGNDFHLLQRFSSKRGPIQFIFSKQPEVVAYCDNEKVAKIHDVRTGKSIELQVGNSQPALAMSPDGSLVATGGYGNRAKLWRVADGQLVNVLATGSTIGGLTPVFSPDGKRIAIGNRNSTTTIFDVASGKQLQILPKRKTQELAFSPNGNTLAVTYVDASVGHWNVADGRLLAVKKTNAAELYTLTWSPNGDLIATAGLRGKITLWNPRNLSIVHELDAPDWIICVRFTPDGTRLITAGGIQKNRTERKVQMWGIPRVIE